MDNAEAINGHMSRAMNGPGEVGQRDDIVLGIDPGTATTGYGFVRRDGDRLSLLRYGVISTPAGLPLHERLVQLHDDLQVLIEQFCPTQMAVEELFFNRNTRSALAVGQARGVVVLTGAKAGLMVAEYTPLEVKQAIAGYGRASKEQVQRMVSMLLGLAENPQPDDAADALAIAICHLHTAEKTRFLAECVQD